eukprot:SAG11_NODE_4619_length_1832_cov_1.834391_2_plen_49_part_00
MVMVLVMLMGIHTGANESFLEQNMFSHPGALTTVACGSAAFAPVVTVV